MKEGNRLEVRGRKTEQSTLMQVQHLSIRKVKSRGAGMLNGSEEPAGFSHIENKLFYTFLGILPNHVLYAINALIVCIVGVPINPNNS